MQVLYPRLESTGVYWRPVFNILEPHVTVIVVNPAHMHQVPGRKTDINDAEWIANLLRHGLLRASFIPTPEQREVRELTRHRTMLLQERARFANRLEKVLEDTNIKLSSVISDILGVSGRAMLSALLAGDTDPTAIARMARGRLRDKRADLEEALVGSMKPHHHFLLDEYLRAIESLDAAIVRVDQAIATRLALYADDLARLDAIPGVGRRTAEIIMAEVGMSIDRFPSARHLASWAGIAPGNYESAGKRLKGRIRHGNPWLRHALVEAGHAAAKSKQTYLAAQYRRISVRRGGKKAVVAVGHSILVIAFHWTRTGHRFFRHFGDRNSTLKVNGCVQMPVLKAPWIVDHQNTERASYPLSGWEATNHLAHAARPRDCAVGVRADGVSRPSTLRSLELSAPPRMNDPQAID